MQAPDSTDDAKPIRVRYYPRRVAQVAAPTPLTPGQALNLANDPQRAERAARTSEARDLTLQPAPRPGLVRRILNRLRSR